MDSNLIHICYSGSLAFNVEKRKVNAFTKLKEWLWTFQNETVDSSTRSGYYLIQAVKILKDNYGVTPQQLKLSFWGAINKGNIDFAVKNGVSEFFQFQGYLPKEESLKKLDSADILFLPLERSTSSDHGTLFIPGKLFEYISKRIPVLAPSEPSDCRAILEASGLGIITKPDDSKEIAEVIYTFIQNKNKLKDYIPDNDYINQFSFEKLTKDLVDIFEKVN